ncbi:MAG: hypothetical protein GX847_01490 [Clostridiales bacterium]|nr:hypothetical protein [Clostridiales bacterium]
MNGFEKHHHKHGEDCACCHDHDENCGCGAPECDTPGVVYTEYNLHDEARVISGRLTVTGDYGAVKETISRELERLAEAVMEDGGIVGHIKVSCQVKTLELFSVTETTALVKTAPDQEIKIILAAIIFITDPEPAEALARKALEAISEAAGGI